MWPNSLLRKGSAFTALWIITAGTVAGAGLGPLDRGFAHPPLDSRPWVYWFWLNGNITSNGITADLEAMRRVGIGGVLIMEVDQGTPKGEAGFGSPPWRQLFKHVCSEANRLGLEVNMNNDAGWCGSGAPFITPELAMQKLVFTETNVQGPQVFHATLASPPTVANYYKDITVLAFPTPAGDARISGFEGKAAFVPQQMRFESGFAQIAPGECINLSKVQVLTNSLDQDGRFSWEVPEGKWTIVRLGHTPTGKDNHPAPEAGRGLESDKLSKAATRAIFEGVMGKLISESKPLAGKTLVSTHIDSWETGSQNWTPLFREEFQRRRGYDPMPYLTIVTGRYVDSAEITERFLWDLRKTVSDLLIENYAGEFRRLAHERGVRLSIEAYDGTPCDDMTYAGQADEPMAEFWSWGFNTAYSCAEMSSAAHVYGKRILGAEAFTANDQEKWQHHPATIKALGDWAFCEGINRFVFHRYALQPWPDRAPGMSMGPWGLHYERTQTWWDFATAWHQYLARCQYLLRKGLFVADICFLQPEGAPIRFTPTMSWREGNTPERPRYNFDGCTSEVVLNRMKVKDGRLTLPDGMSYRMLVLPQVPSMSPALLKKIAELVEAGATVLGPAPTRTPGLAGYPKADTDLRALTARMWNADPVPRASGSSNKRIKHVLWEKSFETPGPDAEVNQPLTRAKWIWYNEGNPAAAVPPGERYFRRVFELENHRQVKSAELLITVDNSFEVWLNGKLLGSGGDFKQVYRFNTKSALQIGTNVLAVKGVNGADYANPAALIGGLFVQFNEGSPLEVLTDRSWQTATNPAPDWLTSTASADHWAGVLEVGPMGMQPWGDLNRSAEPPYVFPSFEAVTNQLAMMGVSPDFEGDPRLRFIHRRDGETEIYFVANSHTNWVRATCLFRVAGKVPELWNPLSGAMARAASFYEENGRTAVSVDFEPAGSTFVIFRQPSRAARIAPLVSLTRNNQQLLPPTGQSGDGAPAAELESIPGRLTTLLAWQPGAYVARDNQGRTYSREVKSLPAPLDLQGPWEVRFQPNRGAPESVTFDRLIDWSQHTDPGVKYFSGTAVYHKTFRVQPGELKAGERHFLSLGSLAIMARVVLNGQDLGVLWKPPYRVEISDALKPGENRLEIKVVNLWINRMIGDEQLPEDSERNPDGTLKRWPDWLNTAAPSPSGRYTFTSWRLWKKDSPLQPSGLLGPVSIIAAREMILQ